MTMIISENPQNCLKMWVSSQSMNNRLTKCNETSVVLHETMLNINGNDHTTYSYHIGTQNTKKSSKCTQNKAFPFHLWSNPYILCTCPYNEGSWPYIDAIGTPKPFPSSYTWLSLTKFKLLHFPPKQQLTIKLENFEFAQL